MVYQGFNVAALFGVESEFNLWAFAGGMVMSGVPGALQALALLTGRTAPESLPSPAEPSSPEPSSPSSGA